ncbi:hypothetical protein KFJ24_02405 [Marinobacter sediminum]|uniref:hypothetical protein n=1 Tax=Marinobacter sediminum TaxID=256323 RepID=UPI002030EF69|nr:hypothetical protein [Marinobacter sediminum]MCM0611325.1 hypothetical protein [Marinobacter sediminum]
MSYKGVLSAVAIALTFMAFLPYMRAIIKGAIRPHVFSWVIWGTTTFVVFLAQLQADGGVGAWPVGVSGVVAIVIALLAFLKRGDIAITGTDWLFFILAMSSLPFWYLTADPLWAVVVLTTVDVLGFGPTIRKSFYHPFSESLLFFSLFATRNLIVILALESYSITTVLFPGAIAVACILLILMISYRRRVEADFERPL